MGFKRFACYFFALALLLAACTYIINDSSDKAAEYPQYTHAVYGINITAECISNNSIGDEWVVSYFMNGQETHSGCQITLPLGAAPVTKTVTATVEEVDKHPDISSEDITFEIKAGEEKSRTMTVTEDGGCYKGCEAVWEVTVSVEFIENITQTVA